MNNEEVEAIRKNKNFQRGRGNGRKNGYTLSRGGNLTKDLFSIKELKMKRSLVKSHL